MLLPFLLLTVLVLIPYGSRAMDPCTNGIYIPMNEEERIKTKPAKTYPLCDSNLFEDWYRFTADGGDQLAVGPQPLNMCGTRIPAYIADPKFEHPKNYAEKSNIKVCAGDPNKCSWEETIKVRRCKDKGGDFFIYYLKPAHTCDSAYCTQPDESDPAGKMRAECKKKSLVPNKNSTKCIKPFPEITFGTVKMGQIEFKKGDHDYSISCRFQSRDKSTDDAVAKAEVMFYFNGRFGFSKTVDAEDGEYKMMGAEQKRINQEVKCKVYGFWEHRGSNKGGRRETAPTSRYAGIRVYIKARKGKEKPKEVLYDGKPIVVQEGDDVAHQVIIKSTVPVTKGSHGDESIQFGEQTRFKTEIGHAGSKVLHGKNFECFTSMKSADWTTGGLVADPIQFVAFSDKGDLKTTINDELHIKVKRAPSGSIWGKGNYPVIQVATRQTTPKTCKVYPDPHIEGFVRKKPYYDFHDVGEHYYLKIPGLTEVAVVTRKCSGNKRSEFDPSCICGVAVREIDEVLVINACGSTRQVYTKDVKDYDKTELTMMEINTHDTNSNRYLISTRSGISVEATKETTGTKSFNLNIVIPEGLEKLAEGVCNENPPGKYCTDTCRRHKVKAEDSLFKQNINGMTAMDTTQYKGKTSPCFCLNNCGEAVMQCGDLKIDKSTNVILKRGTALRGLVDCGDDSDATNPKSSAFTREVRARPLKVNPGNAGRRRRRSTDKSKVPFTDDILLSTGDNVERNAPPFKYRPPIWPTQTKKITEAEARKACMDALQNTAVKGVTGKLNNTEPAIDACIEDIQMTEELSVVTDAAAAHEMRVLSELQIISPTIRMMRKLKEQNETESGNSTSNSTIELLVDDNLLQTLVELDETDAINIIPCRPECEVNGKCENGTCICKPGFLGEGCEVDIHSRPVLISTQDGGECDIVERPCRKTYFTAGNIYPSEKMACKYIIKQFNPMSKMFTQMPSEIIKATYSNEEEIVCGLPELKGAAYVVEVSITINGTSFSNTLNYTILDSRCVDCVEGSCDIMSDGCFIEEKCFLKDELKPGKALFICDPDYNQFKWAKVPAPPCGTQKKPVGQLERNKEFVTDHNTWPWQANLRHNNQHICSATLVHKNWVLTSSSCLEGRNVRDVTVEIDEVYKVKKEVKHTNGLSLLQLDGDSSFAPICLPDKTSKDLTKQTCFTTGWLNKQDDCYVEGDKGSTYRGSVDEPGISGGICFAWNYVKTGTIHGGDVGDHKQCRTPLLKPGKKQPHQKPWCYISSDGKTSACDVPKCDDLKLDELLMTKIMVFPNTICQRVFSKTMQRNHICAGYGRAQKFKGEIGSSLVCRAQSNHPLQLSAVREQVTKEWSVGKPAMFNNMVSIVDWIRKTRA